MLLVAIFTVGYLAIVLEHSLGVNKSAAALLTGVLCWTAYIAGEDPNVANEELLHHLGELSQILFFLLTAMVIVEVIDAHDGFEVITSRVTTTNRRKLLLVTALLSFLLSAVLDNLTTAIVMVSFVRRLVTDRDDRMYFGGAIIIAANAGGVWSPIGDVTTTMLWVGQQITTTRLVRELFLPSIVSVVVPIVWIAALMKGSVRRVGTGSMSSITTDATAATDGSAEPPSVSSGASISPASTALQGRKRVSSFERKLVLFTGTGVLLFVPAFKTLTHLPPVMGILLGLGILWTLTESIHKRKDDEVRDLLTVSRALQRVDAQSVLFFLGILLAISALESDGLLAALAAWMDRSIGNVDLITLAIGLSSSVVDNVPLVAASQGMYSLAVFPTDHPFWLFLAYCAGTGGSILIIGSAAGVAVMGMQGIGFGWYLRKLSVPALLGYAGGAVTYLGMRLLAE